MVKEILAFPCIILDRRHEPRFGQCGMFPYCERGAGGSVLMARVVKYSFFTGGLTRRHPHHGRCPRAYWVIQAMLH